MNKHMLSFVMVTALSWATVAFANPGRELDAPQIESGPVSLSGRLKAVFDTPPPGADQPSAPRLLLIDEQECETELLLPMSEEVTLTADELMAFSGLDVTVTGMFIDRLETRLLVEAMTTGESDDEGDPESAERGVTGSRRWMTILCRFADSTGLPPHPPSWYETLMGDVRPGMNHYWREVSYNKMNLDGSVVVGWYDLPGPRSYYVKDTDGDGTPDKLKRDRAANDCVAQAFYDGQFPQFWHEFNLMFDQNFGEDSSQAFGIYPVIIDEDTWYKGVTWIEDGAADHGTVAHEMAHAMKFPALIHSSCDYGCTYDSLWDVGSGGGCWSTGSFRCPDSADCDCSRSATCVSGCDCDDIPVHLISDTKERAGWISSDRLYKPSGNVAETITIERLAKPPPKNYLMAHLQISPWHYYTVESRRRAGYDIALPKEGVVIHEVYHVRPADRWARVVDTDYDGDCNDGGAGKGPGGWMLNRDKGILVYVEHETSTGYVVSLTTSANDPTYVDADHSGREKGTENHPWDTLREGKAGVIPGGTIYIAPGEYPANHTFRKPLLLKLNGNSGRALIGSD